MNTKVNHKKIYIKAMVATSVCIMIMFFVSTHFINSATKVTKITATVQSSTSQSEAYPQIRKFMIYDGKRYKFKENGALYKFEEDLTEKLGTLDEGNEEKINGCSDDFDTTFAFGCDIYKIPYYDEDFRVAVKDEEGFYICENVEIIDGEVSLSNYFETADIIGNTKEVFVYDHFERQSLGELKTKTFKKLVEIITSAEERKFSNEEYEAIAKSQTNGESFKIVLTLKDRTNFSFYLMPKLNIVMVGDNRFEIPGEFNDELEEMFDGYQYSVEPVLY